VSLPDGVAVWCSNDEVRVVRRGEADEFLPLGLVGIERDEMREFLNRHALAHAMKDHRADQRGSALEHRYDKVVNAAIGVVLGRDIFVPNLRQFATLLGEADEN
jgi:hypothetical protein